MHGGDRAHHDHDHAAPLQPPRVRHLPPPAALRSQCAALAVAQEDEWRAGTVSYKHMLEVELVGEVGGEGDGRGQALDVVRPLAAVQNVQQFRMALRRNAEHL
jgi:hypothetical protein